MVCPLTSSLIALVKTSSLGLRLRWVQGSLLSRSHLGSLHIGVRLGIGRSGPRGHHPCVFWRRRVSEDRPDPGNASRQDTCEKSASRAPWLSCIELAPAERGVCLPHGVDDDGQLAGNGCVSPSSTASLPSARPSRKSQDKSVRGKGNSDTQAICATCVTAPCARGIFGADLGASSGADMCPASDAAIVMPQARMVFEGRVQIKAACSKALCCTLVLPIPSHDFCAKPLLVLFRSDALATDGRLMPPRPETGRRHPGPSGPRRSAPFCSPTLRAPASAACVSASRPATSPAAQQHGCAV